MNALNSRLFAIACAIVFSFASFQAVEAVTITVGSDEFNISTIEGTYPSVLDLLKNQPWWGDSVEAVAAANAVGGALGYPNSSGGRSPLFVNADLGVLYEFASTSVGVPNAIISRSRAAGPLSRTWAVASPVPDSSVTLGMLVFSILGLLTARRKLLRN